MNKKKKHYAIDYAALKVMPDDKARAILAKAAKAKRLRGKKHA